MNSLFVSNSIELLKQPGTGRVEETITPYQRGWVAFEGTYWYAEQYVAEQHTATSALTEPMAIAPGTQVQVIGRRGNTLLVTRLKSEQNR